MPTIHSAFERDQAPVIANPFIWADLSTFDMAEARRFYRGCFGWRFQALADDYHVCTAGPQAAAGLYPMPEFFCKIKMPSFWMSYIRVDDIHETVRLAQAHGAKVEVKPQAAPGSGMVALIRDPAGAGFTCYQGDGLSRHAAEQPGLPVWNELHISDLGTVEPFYTSVFGWAIRPTNVPGRYEIALLSGQVIAGITVTPNEIKGDKEYWGIYFAVPDLAGAQAQIARYGGEVVGPQPLGPRDAVLAYDSQGAAFYLVETDAPPGSNASPRQPGRVKWKAISGLIAVALAVAFRLDWVWGVLFLFWAIADLRLGHTYFIEHVSRRHNPVVYWLIVTTWLVLSLVLLASAII